MSKPQQTLDVDSTPAVKLDKVLENQQKEYEDCLPCRIMGALPSNIPPVSCIPNASFSHAGSSAFVGLGFYTYYSGRKQLLERRQEIIRSSSRFGIAARKASLVGMSALLVSIGAYRMIN